MLRGMAVGSGHASEPLGQLEWNFSQVFGERTPGEEVQDGRAAPREPRDALPLAVFHFTAVLSKSGACVV